MATKLHDWLNQGPFQLALSAGFFSFYAHAGLISVLEDNALFPEKGTGTSAGALIIASWAAGLSSHAIHEKLSTLKKRDFWDPGFGFGLLKGKAFREILSDWLPVKSFADTRFALALSSYHLRSKKTAVFNQGDLILAIYASCAVPGLFHPAKIDKQYYWDGGISDRSSLEAMGDIPRTLYVHIASRSPWRKRNSQSLALPENSNIVSLVVDDLPRLGPNKLHLGNEAYQQARKRMQATLTHGIIDNNIVHLQTLAR